MVIQKTSVKLNFYFESSIEVHARENAALKRNNRAMKELVAEHKQQSEIKNKIISDLKKR